MNRKIALIGAGNIGGELANIILGKGIADVAMVDIAAGVAQGKALDLRHSYAVAGSNHKIKAGDDYSIISGSDVVIVTAGFPRKPGMSRDDLIDMNKNIIRDIGREIMRYAPGAFVIVITNPLDVMTMVMKRVTGFMPNKVVGMAGVLDSARFRCFLAEALGVSMHDVHAMILGSHGDTMVPVIGCCSVAGIPLAKIIESGMITNTDVQNIIQRTRDGGAEIVKLLERGSAYYAPAISAIDMAEAYLSDSKRVMPVTAYLNGEYGYEDVYAGVPVIIGAGGIEKIIDLNLDSETTEMFNRSVDAIKVMNDKLDI